MILDVFNKEFQRIDKISFYSYASYTIELLGLGSFELRKAFEESDKNIMQNGYYILFDKNVVGIMTFFNIETDQDTNNKELTIKGHLANSLLSYRCTQRVTNFRATRTQVVRDLVTDNCISPTDTKRELPIVLSTDSKYIPASDTIDSQVAGNSLDALLEKLLDPEEMGYYVAPVLSDTSITGFEFRVIKGVDRTVGNTYGNPIVVFSTELRNLLSSEYTYNSEDFKNMAYVAGEGEGASRTIISMGETSLIGVDRRESYVDARDLQSTDENGNILSPTEYQNALVARGQEKLSEYVEEVSYTASVSEEDSQFKYGIDYEIGDIVTARDSSIGVSVDAQVTQVTISSIGERSMTDVVLGHYKLGTNKKLKREGVL